jgi:hypothetical protein
MFDRSFTLFHRCCCLLSIFVIILVSMLCFAWPFYFLSIKSCQHFLLINIATNVYGILLSYCLFTSMFNVLFSLLFVFSYFCCSMGWRHYEKIKNWMQCLRFFQFFWMLNFFVLRDDGIEDSMISAITLKDGIKSICMNDWRAIELKNFKTNGQQESQGEVRISLKY